jgi:hypothetical protein
MIPDSLSEHYDVVDGTVISLGERHPLSILLAGALPEKLPGIVLHKGSLVIRYAMPFLYEPDTFYVQRIVDDFGRDFRGDAAFDFAYNQGDAFPRASVLGIRASTGADEQIFLKQLDLARPMLPVVYGAAEDRIPVAQINAAVWLDAECTWHRIESDDSRFPPDLMRAVPCYVMPPAELPLLLERLPNVHS